MAGQYLRDRELIYRAVARAAYVLLPGLAITSGLQQQLSQVVGRGTTTVRLCHVTRGHP